MTDGKARLGETVRLLALEDGAHLAVGRFLGRKTDDIVAGRRFVAGGDPAKAIALPGLPEAEGEEWLRCGDFDGNGLDDLVRKQRRTDRQGDPAVFIHFAMRTENENCGFLDDDNDGLPDDWEGGLIRPGGIDLKALGCKAGRSDVIVEIERFDNVDVRLLKAEVEITVNYFASLPVANPDGSHGIAMHIVYRPPTPHAEFDRAVKEFDERYPPREHRGVVHSMFCGANGDPDFAVAAIMGDNGKFLLNPIVHDVMSHEFGHELGLTHDAFQPHNSPIYMSVMNYTYIRGPGGHPDRARYSEGPLCSLVLNERRLSERLPFPFEKVAFLALPPYEYRLRRGPGHMTLIDWNWNGILGEENIVADVNYDHGTDAGPLFDLGQTDTAPVLVAHGPPATGRLLLFFGRGGALRLREWLGNNVDLEGDRWSAEVSVEDAGVAGDATAAYADNAVWVAYRTSDHVALRRIVPGGERPVIGPASAVPESAGAEPTVASFGKQLALLLWRSPDKPIGLRLIDVKGEQLKFGLEEESNFASQTPVAAVEAYAAAQPALWVALVETTDPAHRSWTQVRRFAPGGGRHWRETRREWVDGQRARLEGADHFATHAAHRMTLLWRPEPGFGPDGPGRPVASSDCSYRQLDGRIEAPTKTKLLRVGSAALRRENFVNNAPPSGISLSGSTSSSLIERVKAGDPAGWSTLTEIYGPLVYSWGRRAGLQASDAADVVQEVFCSVAAHIADFRHEQPTDSFQGWLWVVTRNKIRDHFRRLALEPQAKGGSEAQSRLLAVADDSPDDGSSPDDSPNFQVTHRILELVRGEFEPKTWQAFWLTAVDERSAADAGQELGITVGAVYVAKSRVMARIRLEAAGLFGD